MSTRGEAFLRSAAASELLRRSHSGPGAQSGQSWIVSPEEVAAIITRAEMDPSLVIDDELIAALANEALARAKRPSTWGAIAEFRREIEERILRVADESK